MKIRKSLAGCALSSLCMLASTSSGAFEVPTDNPDVSINFDSTISYGAAWRVQDPDPALIGIANGGSAFGVNADDGNLNYGTGLISSVLKVTSELDIQAGNVGVFVRGSAFYDFENKDDNRDRTSLTPEAEDAVGSDFRLLDAYVTLDGGTDEMPFTVKAGNHVLSWGESTFIQNGINAINPIDVSAIRLPGSELREALLPVGMISASIATSDNTSLELFYQFDWEHTQIDPPGTYFSSNDFAGDGGNRVMLGFGEVAEGDFLGVGRSADRDADDDGQFGIAFRLFVPSLNDTEFGFYYMNYHSRLPLISSTTGTLAGAVQAGTIGAAAPSILGAVLGGAGDVSDGIAAGNVFGLSPTVSGSIAGAALQAEAVAGGPGAGTPTGAAVGGDTAEAFATDAYAQTASYYIEYPENIDLFGISFNTLLGGSGVALQGEVSHRLNVPLQVDDVELLFATLSPISPVDLGGNNQVGNFAGQFETDIHGFKRLDVTQVQATATKIFGRTLGASQLVVIGEAAMTHVHGMPTKDELRFNGPGTFVSGNPFHTQVDEAHEFKPAESADHFADATSWGYRAAARLDYSNVFNGINLSPRVAVAHDVSGITPGPGGNFLEGRKALTLGLGGNYQSEWSADIAYTRFFGAGRYNLINDRDFIAINFKRSL